MIEIRFHGRGGQGAVVASELLAKAAVLDGLMASAFPSFGSERRGAPVMAFCRIDGNPIRTHADIYEPDYVVVLDPKLIRMVNVLEGLKPGGKILINSSKEAKELNLETENYVITVDAISIALKHGLGTAAAPILNTAMIGAFAGVCPEVTIDSIIESILANAPAKKEKNAAAAREAYEIVKKV